MAILEETLPDQPLPEVDTVSAPGLGSTDVPVASSSKTPAAQRRGKAESVWETHKATIKALYIDQDRSLKDVREIMKVKQGFDAS